MMACALSVRAQPKPTLHVAVVELENFVAVGSANEGAAGLYGHQRDTLWTHSGWGNTRNFGLDAVSPDSEIIYLACGNGVIQTNNGGATWRISTGWRIREVLDVVVDPNAPRHVYIATAYGVWRSTDQGETWKERNGGIPSPQSTFTGTIAADRGEAGHLIVGSEEGLYRTTNGAQQWTAVGPRDVAIRDVVQSAANPDVWLAGTEDQGVLISQDGGLNWSFSERRAALGNVFAVAVDPSNADRMAAAGFEGDIYLSTDGGDEWQYVGAMEEAVHALIFDVTRPQRLWAGTLGDGVFYTDDDGSTWQYGGLDGAVIWNMEFFDVAATTHEEADAE